MQPEAPDYLVYQFVYAGLFSDNFKFTRRKRVNSNFFIFCYWFFLFMANIMSELDPMDLNCSSFMTIFNSCLALCSSFLQPSSQSWSTGSRYQHLMIVFMHPSKDFSIIKDVKPNSPSWHYMNTCRQEEEHGVLVGHLLDQPHVMSQEGLVALVPAPTPKYKRQVANFSTSSAFVFFSGANWEGDIWLLCLPQHHFCSG